MFRLNLLKLFIFALAMQAQGIEAADLPSVRFLEARDGDTINVLIPYLPPPFRELGVRLEGVDTPEMKGHCPEENAKAMRAKLATEGWLQHAETIDLVNVTLGIYGRLVATVLLDGTTTLQDLLVDSHLAVKSDKRGRTMDWCEEMP